MALAAAPRWEAGALQQAAVAARAAYRQQRLEEPPELYGDEFEDALQAVAELLERTTDLEHLRDEIPNLLHSKPLRRALCYLTGPPTSDDDLKVIADVKLTRAFFKDNPEGYDAVADTVSTLLDRKRFPWAADGRDPEPHEVELARVATAALIAHQSVQAHRRNEARQLEQRTAEVLEAHGFEKVDKRRITAAGHWPAPGQFCGECSVAGRQADLAVTLKDTRYMPIECKVSGSEVNSIKRLNNDALAKFAAWRNHFGDGQTLPVAVLEGVFNFDRLTAAQGAGASLIWGHDLNALGNFLDAAVP